MMQVYIGHILFPTKASYSTLSVNDSGGSLAAGSVGGGGAGGEVKRIKGEGWSRGVIKGAREAPSLVSLSSVTECIQKALEQHTDYQENIINDGRPCMDVHVDKTGKGVSFCLVPGILYLSLTTSPHTVITCPEKITAANVEKAAQFPRITELSMISPHGELWNNLPVYWEERRVVMMPSMRTDIMVNCFSPCVKDEVSDARRAFLEKRILVVGAGGIGCELLKVLVLYGFCNLDVLDLDTIDATNLNRQFLFQKEDVGASKANTARKAILSWFKPTSFQRVIPNIRAHHADIKNKMYDDDFFRQFDIVLNALDNVSARQHVNRMCMRTGTPLIESGTMGYNGQVQPIVRGLYECYDCHPRVANQQTVAVCTIHARPTTMVHCVHYAKELYERLFGDKNGEVNDEMAFVDDFFTQDRQEEKEEESENENKEKEGKKEKDPSLMTAASIIRGKAYVVARSLFHDKIHDLLSMKTVWATTLPVPLSSDVIQQVAEEMVGSIAKGKYVVHPHNLRENQLTLEETIMLFFDSFVRCVQRGTRNGFRKEDDDTVDFVAAVSNLRAMIFHISPLQTVEEIRSIAGAIVPAIATTNAIVAAAVVQQALCLLNMREKTCQFASPQIVYVRRAPQLRRRLVERIHDDVNDSCCSSGGSNSNIIAIYNSQGKRDMSNGGGDDRKRKRWTTDLFLVHSAPPSPPSTTCLVCRERYPTVRVLLDTTRTTLGDFARNILQGHLSMVSVSIVCGTSVLYEEGEYEAMAATPLAELMTAENKPLELLVDDLDHEVEWRLVVEHRRAIITHDDDGGGCSGAAVEMHGLDAALQLEQRLITESKAAAAESNKEEEGRAVPTSTGAADEGRTVVEVLLSDSEEDDVDVVEID